ncbi:MAG: TIGR02584 family CRISPR-associated protein [Rubrivivax sp.]|nr:TIGR02584 family CRISPR-associated protein [Rubrivivax sp.]
MSNTEPTEFSRRALVCVLGRNPQILTETLFALAVRAKPRWVPTEIHVITTALGAEDARAKLLDPVRGHFHRLVAEYLPGASIAFDGTSVDAEGRPRWIHVICRADDPGQPLDDIDDPEDSAATGNAILRVIAPLVNDPHCAIHASIAGGRKTMGALLCSAISLLGRPQDQISHVLVPSELEGHPEFFYPPRQPTELTLRDGRKYAAHDALVRLARVPLLRFAAGMRSKILESRLSYEQLVAQAEQDLLPQPVVLSMATRTVRVGSAVVTLEPMEMAWYAYLAERRQRHLAEPGLVAPGFVRVDKDPTRNIGIHEADLRRVFARLTDVQYKPPSRRLDEFKDEFKSRVSYINAKLRSALGEATAQRLLIAGPSARGTRDGQYGLMNLDAGLIRFV